MIEWRRRQRQQQQQRQFIFRLNKAVVYSHLMDVRAYLIKALFAHVSRVFSVWRVPAVSTDGDNDERERERGRDGDRDRADNGPISTGPRRLTRWNSCGRVSGPPYPVVAPCRKQTFSIVCVCVWRVCLWHNARARNRSAAITLECAQSHRTAPYVLREHALRMRIEYAAM